MSKKNKKKYNYRAKTPIILQMEAVECGAAALAIILAYYKKYVSLEELRVECEVTRDGVNALNIINAAENYGLLGEGYSVEIIEDIFELKFPAIIFWEFNHFIVIEGHKKGKFYINDPASGPRTVSEEEFNEKFTGVILTFEPTDKFETGGEQTSLLSYIGHWLKGSYSAVTFFVITGLFLVFPGLVIPIFSKIFIDDILIKRMNNWIFPLLIGMIFTAILRGVLVLLQKYYLLRFEEKLAISSSARLFWHILKLPVQFFTQRYIGEIGSRIAINNSIAKFVAGNLSETILNLSMIVFFASIMFYYDILMTLIGIVIVGINIALLYYISQKIKNQKLKLLYEEGKLFGFTYSGLHIIESLKASGNELDFFLKYSSNHAKTVTEDQKLNFATNLLIVTPGLLFSINTALILFIGSLRVMDGMLTMGMLVAFQSLMTSFITPVTDLVQLGGTFQEMNGNAKRIEDILIHPEDSQVEESENHNIIEEKKLSGKVEINKISFGYGKKDNPLIKNFSVKLGPGSQIALVGKSGSGKSTIGRLVAGLYDPWEGEILFDGHIRKEFRRVVLNNSIAVVDQNISMFNGTVKENISLWDETLPDDDIIQACKDACIHDAIVQRYHSYEHKIEEGGRNFSGGEKQRIEIARALAVNPTILILDEATSALDSIIEKEIMENVKKRGCTCLIIAHRLSTIKDCDEIIVLKNGAIEERGRHEKLVRSGGYYSRLINE